MIIEVDTDHVDRFESEVVSLCTQFFLEWSLHPYLMASVLERVKADLLEGMSFKAEIDPDDNDDENTTA